MLRMFMVVLVLTACTPIPTTTPHPTLDIIRIGMMPAVRPWQRHFTQCNDQMPGIALAFDEAPQSDSPEPLSSYDFFIQLGSEIPDQAFATQLGSERITWIVNAKNPASLLAVAELTQIYEGKTLTWDKSSESTAGFTQAVSSWVYSPRDLLYPIFQEAVWGQRSYPPQANLAPDPAAVLEAVSTNPGAIGYLPESWLQMNDAASSNLHSIEIIDATGARADELPVLAVSFSEPEGINRDILLCVLSILH